MSSFMSLIPMYKYGNALNKLKFLCANKVYLKCGYTENIM